MSRNFYYEQYLRENIVLFRRRLKLSQGKFISNFLSDETGKPLFSVAKLSNIENKGGKDLPEICRTIAKKLNIDSEIFSTNPNDFSQKIDLVIRDLQTSSDHDVRKIAQLADESSQLESLVRIMSDYFTLEILSGRLNPGDRIPSDRSLSDFFNTGRFLIREALKILCVLGLIVIVPGQGSFIAPGNSDFFMEPLSWIFFWGEKNIEDVLVVKRILESESARLAALHASQSDIDYLKLLYKKSVNIYHKFDMQSFFNLDIEIHLSIAAASQNRLILNLLKTIRRVTESINKQAMVNRDQMSEIFNEHEMILNAIFAKDQYKAAEKMTLHITNLSSRYHSNMII